MLTDLAIPARAEVAPTLQTPLPEDVREQCAARAGIYRLLSGVFVEEPTAAFVDALRDAETLRALAEVGLAFDADFLETATPLLVDQLACEFATMFVASGGFPPIESVRLTGRHQQEPYFAVRETYRRLGFSLQKGRFAVFEDQLGVELMFAAELLDRCIAALDADDASSYRRWERELKRFWTLHLGKWVRGYARLVERAAEHSFYREMGRFLGAFAAEEIALLGLRIEDVDQGRAVVPKAEVKVEHNPDEPVCNGCSGGDVLREFRVDVAALAEAHRGPSAHAG